jgi:hypothetical protein
MLKNRQLAADSEAAIWAYEAPTLRGLTGEFLLEDLKRWINSIATDDQVTAFISKYGIPVADRAALVAACNLLNDDFIGEDEIYEGRVHPKILFDYETYILVKTSPIEADCVVNTYIVHETALTAGQISSLDTKMGFTIKSDINANIGVLE